MEQHRRPVVGEPVVYVNPVRVACPALVTSVHGEKCVNVVFVSLDGDKGDSYGRQIEGSTSVVHASTQEAPGNYWRYPQEQGKSTEVTA